jgi:CheY-like chemotaxis protein/MinD-like ATPase involved in chromosome partitioning or flagellar assembly
VTELASLTGTRRAEELPPPDGARVLAVCGVSGGCGATTLALNLAAELARPGQECLLVELARQAGTLASNLAIEPTRTVADLLAEPDRLTPAVVRQTITSVSPILDVLVAPYQNLDANLANRVSWRHVIGLVDICRHLAPLVVLDVPCTFDDLLFETLALADRVLLVGVQTVSSLRTMQMLRDTAEREEGVRRPLLVVNRYDPNLPSLNAASIAKIIGAERVWTVADDYPSVMTALYHGRPIRETAPHSRVLGDLAALRGGLAEEEETEPPAPVEPCEPMTVRTLRVLHVEDDPFQQLEMTLHLGAIPDLSCTVTSVPSEAEAVDAFRASATDSQPFDVVLLDYQLSQGNGLSCLRQLRRIDPLVPILVISSLEQPQVASELLAAGADDFVSKSNLSAARLATSLQAALARVEACRARLGPLPSAGLFGHVQRAIAAESDAELQRALHELRAAGWPKLRSLARIQHIADLICKELPLLPDNQSPVVTALLTLLLRLFGGEHEENQASQER